MLKLKPCLKLYSSIFLMMVVSPYLAYSQVIGKGPNETYEDYNRRYLYCNHYGDQFGSEGFREHWNQCMRDTYAPKANPPPANRSTKPQKGSVTVTPKKPQNAGNLADTAKVDPAWAGDTRKRIAKKADEAPELAEMEVKAPYGDRNCGLFMPAPNRGVIDWDWVKVTNRCSYPIAILVCYYDVGQKSDCMPGGKGSFQTIELKPGETGTSVSTSKRLPWQVYGLVCNMTPQKHNRMLCVLPDSYKKS